MPTKISENSTILKTFRTRLAETHDARKAAMQTACAFTIDVKRVATIVREAVAANKRGKRPVTEFKMNTPKSAKGMFKGQTEDDLATRLTRDKAKVKNANKRGESTDAAVKDEHRVEFAQRAKHKGDNKWTKKKS